MLNGVRHVLSAGTVGPAPLRVIKPLRALDLQ